MALLPGTKGEDILAWRGVAEVVGEIGAMSAERMADLLPGESLDLLKGVRGRLEEEIAFEERFSAEFSRVMEELGRARHEDEFIPLLPRFNRLAEEYFRKRESVVALHTLCGPFRDGLVRRVLRRVEELLEMEGLGRPPSPYCWLASGGIGRSEQTFCDEPAWLLIHGDSSAAGYFETFMYRVLAFFERIGLGNSGALMKSLWHGSRAEWRRENVDEPLPDEQRWLAGLVRRADLRPVAGDAPLAGEMINIVRSVLDFHHGELRETGKMIAGMPHGLDFFSRLRVAKSGPHRGEFDLEQFALAPLVANVRMLAISCGLHDTATIDRIKGLQERGRLSVELTERLLHAFHDFTRLKVIRQIVSGCEDEGTCFIVPQELDADGERRLRNGLEAVSGLEKIAYLHFSEQG